MKTPTKLFKIGRFTIAEVKETIIDEKGKERILTGVGIARLSDTDKYIKDIAISIATGRADKALEAKKSNKRIQNLLMG